MTEYRGTEVTHKIKTLLYLLAAYFQGVIDGRKATKNVKGLKRMMLLGDAGSWVERGRDIEEFEHRTLNGQRIRDERPSNRR